MANVSDKLSIESQNTHFMLNNIFFENNAVYEIMWKNIVEEGRRQMTIRRMRIARWIPKATNTHLDYAILIAFPLQQWLHKRASTLRYTYISCLVII
jgi:hypothetical protein